jgi:hypothetical protein
MNYYSRNGDLMRLTMILGFVFATIIYLAPQERPRPSSHFTVSPAALYETYNELYFDNKLPKKIDILEADVPDSTEQLMGLTLHTVGTHYYKMYISPTFNDSEGQEEMTTLHEMCHQEVWEEKEANGTAAQADPKDSHGVPFQNCMKRLARQDAFWNIW